MFCINQKFNKCINYTLDHSTYNSKKEKQRKGNVYSCNWDLLFRSYFPFDHTVQPYYFAAYVWQAATTVSDGFLIGVCDTLFVCMLINAIGQYKQLQYKLETMQEFAVKKIAAQMEVRNTKLELRFTSEYLFSPFHIFLTHFV